MGGSSRDLDLCVVTTALQRSWAHNCLGLSGVGVWAVSCRQWPRRHDFTNLA